MGPRRKRLTAADLAKAKAIADSVGQGSSSTPAGGTSTQITHAHPLTDQWLAMIPERKRLTAADRARGFSEAKAIADSVGQGSSSTPAGGTSTQITQATAQQAGHFQGFDNDQGLGDFPPAQEADDDDLEMGSGPPEDEVDNVEDVESVDNENVLIDVQDIIGGQEEPIDESLREYLPNDLEEELRFMADLNLGAGEVEDAEEVDFVEEIGRVDEETEAGKAPESPPEAPMPDVQEGEIDASSRVKKHNYNKNDNLSDFHMALGLWAHTTDISRAEWEALRDALKLLKGQDGRAVPDITALPSQLDTLKHGVTRRLPLTDMREAEIPLRVEKLPTLPEMSKGKLKGTAISDSTVLSTMHFMDPVSLFKAYVSSNIHDSSHKGLGHVVDEPKELFEGQCWLGSIRATSGEFAHSRSAEANIVDTLFPGDWVAYFCDKEGCKCLTQPEEDYPNCHLGRITCVGLDYRSRPLKGPGQIVIGVQEAYRYDDPVLQQHKGHSRDLADFLSTFSNDPQADKRELLLSKQVAWISETDVDSVEAVFIDRLFGENLEDPSPQFARAPKRRRLHFQGYPKHDSMVSSIPQDWDYFVRRVFDFEAKTMGFMCHTHPIRGELEVMEYGRDFYLGWDKARNSNLKVISCPITMFVDGFGLWRNSYRSLMGFYATPAALTAEERSRRANIFPIALGPHGSNFKDVVNALRCLLPLEKGMEMDIKGQKVIVCVYTLCYTGDMPQQALNSGFKGPRATKFCRFCFIGEGTIKSGNPSDIFSFDIAKHGRYHFQSLEMRRFYNTLKTKAQKQEFAKQWGIAEENPALPKISPGLDIIVSRPGDSAHSEYKGVSEKLHYLLVNHILRPTAKVEYQRMLRVWPFPPGWIRLQSPLHHFASYNLSSHARWSVIIPPLLRSWLRPEHVEIGIMNSTIKAATKSNEDAIGLIVSVFAKHAKSNSVLMGTKVSAADRANFARIVLDGRMAFQKLHQIVIDGTQSNRRIGSRAGTPASIHSAASTGSDAASMAGNVAGSVAGGEAGPSDVKKASSALAAELVKPNMHTAMHFELVMQEYGLPVNTNTLPGESEHAFFKNKALQTNRVDVEKGLLNKINVQQTARLILRDAFSQDDPGLTQQMARLYSQCPHLFESTLSRTDRRTMADEAELADSNGFDIPEGFEIDPDHRRPLVLGRIPPAKVSATFHRICGGSLPVKPSQVRDPAAQQFRTGLREAYEHDYGMAGVYASSRSNLQWCKKFGFTNKTDKRFVFSIGQYVRFRGTRYARVDHVFVQDLDQARRVFLLLTEFAVTNNRDHILDLAIVDEMAPIIVGLPAIAPDKIYIVKVENVGNVLVDWSVEQL